MSDDLWRTPMRDLMLKSAQVRAAHYRQQATELRAMAEDETDTAKSDLLELAAKYDALADSVSPQH